MKIHVFIIFMLIGICFAELSNSYLQTYRQRRSLGKMFQNAIDTIRDITETVQSKIQNATGKVLKIGSKVKDYVQTTIGGKVDQIKQSIHSKIEKIAQDSLITGQFFDSVSDCLGKTNKIDNIVDDVSNFHCIRTELEKGFDIINKGIKILNDIGYRISSLPDQLQECPNGDENMSDCIWDAINTTIGLQSGLPEKIYSQVTKIAKYVAEFPIQVTACAWKMFVKLGEHVRKTITEVYTCIANNE